MTSERSGVFYCKLSCNQGIDYLGCMKNTPLSLDALQKENQQLRAELEAMKRQLFPDPKACVDVPDNVSPVFEKATAAVTAYFSSLRRDPSEGEIEINGERYLLVRSASLSYEFLTIIAEMYGHLPKDQGISIGKNMLFDIAHVLGKKDARAFHKKMKLKDPVEKLSAGPVHFAFTGWAKVEILPDSNPVNDPSFYLHYTHHNSFESSAWLDVKQKSVTPVCIMNSGYASGWCSESFDLSLTAVEVTCRAKGDACCSFIMAPVDRIEEYLQNIPIPKNEESFQIPEFLERKKIEEAFKRSLEQKEALLQEVHHRVKNNLQLITSMLRLQHENSRSEYSWHLLTQRIQVLSMIHQSIYQDSETSHVELCSFVRKVLLNGIQQEQQTGKQWQVDWVGSDMEQMISFDRAIPVGLLLNELLCQITNHVSNSKVHFKGEVVRLVHAMQIDLRFSSDGACFNQENQPNYFLDLLIEQVDAELNRTSTENDLHYQLILTM